MKNKILLLLSLCASNRFMQFAIAFALIFCLYACKSPTSPIQHHFYFFGASMDGGFADVIRHIEQNGILHCSPETLRMDNDDDFTFDATFMGEPCSATFHTYTVPDSINGIEIRVAAIGITLYNRALSIYLTPTTIDSLFHTTYLFADDPIFDTPKPVK